MDRFIGQYIIILIFVAICVMEEMLLNPQSSSVMIQSNGFKAIGYPRYV